MFHLHPDLIRVSLSWNVVYPEDFQTAFDKKESPVRIRVEELRLEEGSKTIQAKIRFNRKMLSVKSNKIDCDRIVGNVHGVRRKRPNEDKEEEDFWNEIMGKE